MTKRCLLLIFAISLFSFPYISYAQDGGYDTADSEKEESKDIAKIRKESFSQVRPGMQVKKIAGLNMLVPEGTQFYKQGAQVRMEEDGDYSARRFQEMDVRLQKTEKKVRMLERELTELRKTQNEMKEKSH